MQNFFYSIPTKIAFGKGAVEQLPDFVKEFGTKVLIVYGGGSIKRMGLYDTVIKKGRVIYRYSNFRNRCSSRLLSGRSYNQQLWLSQT